MGFSVGRSLGRRHEAQNLAGIVGQQPKGAVGALTHVTDALALILEQRFCGHYLVALEDEALQLRAGETADEGIALPFGKRSPV